MLEVGHNNLLFAIAASHEQEVRCSEEAVADVCTVDGIESLESLVRKVFGYIADCQFHACFEVFEHEGLQRTGG